MYVPSNAVKEIAYRSPGTGARAALAKQPKLPVCLPGVEKNLSGLEYECEVADRELEAATTEWNSLAKQLEHLNKALAAASGKDVKNLKNLIRQVGDKIDKAAARSVEATREINRLTQLRDEAKKEVRRAKDEISKKPVDVITRTEEHVQESTHPDTVPPPIASDAVNGDKPPIAKKEGIHSNARANTVNQEKREAGHRKQNAGFEQTTHSSNARIKKTGNQKSPSEAAPHQLIIGTEPSSDQRSGDAQYIRTIALSCLTFGMAGLVLNQRYGVSPSDGDRSFLPSTILLGLAVGEAAETVSGNLDRVSDSLKTLWLVLAFILVGMHFQWW